MKPWISEPRGRQLEAFVGVWDIKTSQFETTPDLLAAACALFGLDHSPDNTVDDVARQIEDLGKKGRASRARTNRYLIATGDEGQAKGGDAVITVEGLEKMVADSRPVMVDGSGQDCVGELDIDPARLLRNVVSAVISAGQGHILYEFPELLEFMGSRIPSRAEVAYHHKLDERMFEAKARWPNLKPGMLL